MRTLASPDIGFGVLFFVAFVAVTSWLTVVAYRDGVAGRLDALKAHCRVIGISVIAIAMFGIALGYEASISASRSDKKLNSGVSESRKNVGPVVVSR